MITGPVPVFIISFNRGDWLRRCVAACRKLATWVDVVIHDNGSDDPSTLRCLDLFEAEGIAVVRRGKIRDSAELNQVNDTIESYFAGHGPAPYVVTDCDIDISGALPDALQVYDELLAMFPDTPCVGPMIRIRDVPRHYPLFAHVMNRHIEQFWHRRPEWVSTKWGQLAIQRAPIDTTFALYRAGEPFFRLREGIRVYEPYEARHLDWYLSEAELRNAPYFYSSSDQIAHWSNRDELLRRKQLTLQYDRFIYVERDEEGRLQEKTFLL
jgi:glycosyltransferase involved in cell wall biosynthesis